MRHALAAIGLFACGAIVFAFACASDYSEDAPVGAPDRDAGTGSDGNAISDAIADGGVEQRDADPFVKCAMYTCEKTCCLPGDASATGECCGDNTAGRAILLHCATEENCPGGQICCIHEGGSMTTSECATAGECSMGGGELMCNSNALKTGCPSGVPCSESHATTAYGLPAGYGVCYQGN